MYIEPKDVKSPRRHFTLVAILDDGKTLDNPTGEDSVSMSIGRWKSPDGSEEPVLGIRWNGNNANPIGNPQSRGLPTWFVVPQHLRQMIFDRMHMSARKRAMLQEVFGDDLFTGPDGAGWICDTCGKPIRNARQGVLEWVNIENAGDWQGSRMFIVHHLSASPLRSTRPLEGCYVSQDRQRQSNASTDWSHLDEFLGPDGLTQLLSMIAEHNIPVQDILGAIQRLHLPRYERARQHMPAAVSKALIEPNLPPGFYWQDELEQVLENHTRQK